MSVGEYKAAIKDLIDLTDNEILLKQWKEQLEWDVRNQDSMDLSSQEWMLVQEGLAEYKNKEVISMEDFMSKRK